LSQYLAVSIWTMPRKLETRNNLPDFAGL
jgi:hypothetical protein